MCTTCGCSDDAQMRLTKLDGSTHSHEHTHADGSTHSHEHAHEHEHEHEHKHENSAESVGLRQAPDKSIQIEQDILFKNNLKADENRRYFHERSILALNLVSAPGSGKTTLLEKTILALKNKVVINVLEGDQETANDAQRIRATGIDVIQINTGAGCHLESKIVSTGLKQLNPENGSILFIENVGNLVCPALFDLGERSKVAILSVTEGEDKPLKYPHMFKAASILILSKIDLLPYLKFDIDLCIKNALIVNPEIRIIKVSALSGEGLSEWIQLIEAMLQKPL
ncbi:MAG: hydrogenase nickel incorporation protein HypB [Candidatus Obscuribacterales bacterium]|nr:hydrogenase nickel incorporation protein HypB [Candidatus Obscuribacterales bacterium]